MWKWETEGNPKGVVVIVHGAMEHHGRYSWLIEMWRSSGYHVVMGDLPGQGAKSRSDRGHIDSFQQYLDEVEQWLQAAYQFEVPVFLLGHSMGGLVTIRLLQTSKLNVAGVILSSPCLGLIQQPPNFLKLMAKGLNVLSPTLKFKTGLTLDMATRNQIVKELEANDSLYITKVSVRWYQELVKTIGIAFEQIQETQDIPIFLMQAGDDQVVNKDLVKEWFYQLRGSDLHFKEWPNLYHEIFNEPEREDVFMYAEQFVRTQLKLLGYVVD
ncbi:alpha/beta hydrolase [Mangrovibacillus cuniculi]|uniref:Alpha/beta hydrolase n=1 Tax=Mangrovibacillus cuniculi TaxID=2593652 RepID=A0A7S8CC78_9BACI|nr:alpha/beta hydrolase [Mangrovibacillus cuniculi]QPC47298.1 alpha/beta hydrolase [Mangrovibacillus cuniculi]